ncbi:MAG: hypothetical protein EXR62_15910 [Chloroflexi bacterium]|nr:hypothetical protein [Chloroflexota bacterium]
MAIFPWLTPDLLVIGLIFAGTTIAVLENWKLSLLALLAEFLLCGWLLGRLGHPDVAILVFAIGGIVGLILYMTIHWVEQNIATPATLPRASMPVSLFRLLAVSLVGLGLYTVGTNSGLLLSAYIAGQVFAWLGAIGTIAMVTRRHPFRLGLGMLTFLLGFITFFLTLEDSLLVAGTLGGIMVLVVLTISYLSIASDLVAKGPA